MIRTLCTLTPGQTRDGSRVLRGELARDVTTVDEAGHERRYPAGTALVLRRGKGETYSLLALLPDDPPEPARKSNHRSVTVNRQLRTLEPSDFIPF